MMRLVRHAVVLAGLVAGVVASGSAASAQGHAFLAADACHITGTIRQFRDNEFSRYRAKAAVAGSLGLGCEVFQIKGMPFGSSLGLGVFGEVVEVAPIQRQSGQSGDMLTKHMGTMGFVGGSAELRLPSIASVTPSLLMRYGVEVGSIVLPRGYYADANGWEKVFAKRYTNEFSLGGCLDYNRKLKVCAEFSKLVYDTYPHIWFDPKGVQQGRPEAITAANEIGARVIVPFSALRM